MPGEGETMKEAEKKLVTTTFIHILHNEEF